MNKNGENKNGTACANVMSVEYGNKEDNTVSDNI